MNLLLLLACDGGETKLIDDVVDTGTTVDVDDTGGETGDPGPQWEIVATTTDYTNGALVTIDSTGVLHDSILPVSSDAAVVAGDGEMYVLNRSSENTVQVFKDGSYSAPTLEFTTSDASNPVDIAVCGGQYFVSRYLIGDVAGYNLTTGGAQGNVGLSPYADADGNAEPDSLYAAPNGALYVALNQIDYGGTYNSVDGSGTLAKIDCEKRLVTDTWDVGPNPHFTVSKSDPNVLFVDGGDYFNSDYSGPSLDGVLYAFDTSTDTLQGPLLTEADLGGNLGAIVDAGNGYALTTIDSAYEWTVACINLNDWSYTTAPASNIYVGGMAATPDGMVWAAQGAGYGTDAPGPTGFVPYDPTTCTAGAAVTSTLGPSSLAVRTW